MAALSEQPSASQTPQKVHQWLRYGSTETVSASAARGAQRLAALHHAVCCRDRCGRATGGRPGARPVSSVGVGAPPVTDVALSELPLAPKCHWPCFPRSV